MSSVKVGEVPYPVEVEFVHEDGTPIDLTGYAVHWVWRSPGSSYATTRPAVFEAPNRVIYIFEEGDITVAGELMLEAVAVGEDHTFKSDTVIIHVAASIAGL